MAGRGLCLLEGEQHLCSQEAHRVAVDVVIARELELRPQLADHVPAELVFHHGREEAAAEKTTARRAGIAGEKRSRGRIGTAGGDALHGEQTVIAGAKDHVLYRVQGPGRTDANQIGLLANAGFRGVAIEADFTPTWP